MITLTPDIKYVVGIDFGHGECSAALCEIGWGKKSRQLSKPGDLLAFGSNEFTIPSIYSIVDGKMIVGYAAVDEIEKTTDFKLSFKQQPSKMSEEEKLAYSEFMKQCYAGFKDKTDLAPGNHVVFLSCPSGWSDDDKDTLKNLASRVGLPVGCIWPESRAGMFNNMETQTESIRSLMQEGCILADIGSSTIDFSYLNRRLDTPIRDSGIHVGAQALDMILYYYILSLPWNESARKYVDRIPWLKDALVFECRKAKEKFFSSKQVNPLVCSFDFREQFCEDQELSGASFFCKRNHGGDVETITQLFHKGLEAVGLKVEPDPHFTSVDWDAVNHGYYSRIAQELERFVKDSVKDNPAKLILLSGGASTMFIGEKGKQLLEESILIPVFGKPVEFAFDGMPSTSVSRGIASLGRAYSKILGCHDDQNHYDGLKEAIEKAIDYHKRFLAAGNYGLGPCVIPGLEQDFNEYLRETIGSLEAPDKQVAEKITDIVMPVVEDYVKSFEGKNMDELRKGMQKTIESHYDEITDASLKIVKDYITKQLEYEKKYIDKLIDLYTASLKNDLNLENISLSGQLSLPSVDNILYNIDIYDRFDDFTKGIVYLCLSIVFIALNLTAGLLPFIISYVAHGLKEKDWSIDEFTNWFMDKFSDTDFIKIPLNRLTRKQLRSVFEKKKSQTRDKIKEDLVESLGYKDFNKTVLDTFSVAADKNKEISLKVVSSIFD